MHWMIIPTEIKSQMSKLRKTNACTGLSQWKSVLAAVCTTNGVRGPGLAPLGVVSHDVAIDELTQPGPPHSHLGPDRCCSVLRFAVPRLRPLLHLTTTKKTRNETYARCETFLPFFFAANVRKRFAFGQSRKMRRRNMNTCIIF